MALKVTANWPTSIGGTLVLDAAAEVAFRADGLRGLGDTLDGAERGSRQHPTEGKRGQDRKAAAHDQDQPQGIQRLLGLGDREGHLNDPDDAIRPDVELAVDQQRLVLNGGGLMPARATQHHLQPFLAERQGRAAEVEGPSRDFAVQAARLHPAAGEGSAGQAALLRHKWGRITGFRFGFKRTGFRFSGIGEEGGLAHQVGLDAGIRGLRLGEVQDAAERDHGDRQDRRVQQGQAQPDRQTVFHASSRST